MLLAEMADIKQQLTTLISAQVTLVFVQAVPGSSGRPLENLASHVAAEEKQSKAAKTAKPPANSEVSPVTSLFRPGKVLGGRGWSVSYMAERQLHQLGIQVVSDVNPEEMQY